MSLETFERDGYVIVRGLLSPEEVGLLSEIGRVDRDLVQQKLVRADGEGGDAERDGATHAERHPERIGAGSEPGGHDDDDAREARDQARDRLPRQRFTQEHPSERRDEERKKAGDDHGDAGLDTAHRLEIQAEIERVLAEAEDDHGAPLRAAEPDALTRRPADREGDEPGEKKADRQRQKRRRVGDDPRIALRERDDFAEGEAEALRAKLGRLDAASSVGSARVSSCRRR